MEAKDSIALVLSALALFVSGFSAWLTFSYGKKKAARDLWQRALELYIDHPAHISGHAKTNSRDDEQLYRMHVSFIFLAMEELLSAYPTDSGWHALIKRHLKRHSAYVAEIINDPDRSKLYNSALVKKMKDTL